MSCQMIYMPPEHLFARCRALMCQIELKTAWHRNRDKPWSVNDICDIDAMALAVPSVHGESNALSERSRSTRARSASAHGKRVEGQNCAPLLVGRLLHCPSLPSLD
jgi:hypothetical protein